MSACVSSLAFLVAGRGIPTVCRLCRSGEAMPVKPTLRRMLATLLPAAAPPGRTWDVQPLKTDPPSSDPTSRHAASRNRRWRGFEGG